MDELTHPLTLSDATLDRMPDGVRVPRYDRSTLTPGIVHIGLGNFHRAHQAWYLHRLFDQGLNTDWAILGAGVRAHDAAQCDRMLAQDCLTTLIELDPAGRAVEVTGAMIGYVAVAPDNAPLIAAMSDPTIRIVALTVTEGGYYQNAQGGFDADHADIRADAANPGAPRTAFGAMVAALGSRRDAGQGAFACQSCDNLQGNGGVLRQTVMGLARLSDPDLADWIGMNSSFPNSMVDCIVPATGPAELALVRDIGIDDHVPVTHENFRQWVIEDDFCAGRPDWDRAGATFSDKVHDYEVMKIRILNAGHQVIANIGEILSVATISECMAHPAIHGLFRKVETEEIAPHVSDVPGMTTFDYVTLIETRFANTAIVDTTRRVAFDGSSRHPGFVMPLIRKGLANDCKIDGLILVEALWARMCEGTREDGTTIEPNDPFWNDLTTAAKSARTHPQAWLEQTRLYGDLGGEMVFADRFAYWLQMIWDEGAEMAVGRYLGQD